MKTPMLVLFFLVSFCYAGLTGASRISILPAEKISPATDSTAFTRYIQPLLQKSCSPCHFTGGKMYEKMPFDAPSTILSHQSGVLKRFKGDEHSVIRQFIEENNK